MRKRNRLIGLLLAVVLAIGLLCTGCQTQQAQGTDSTAAGQTVQSDADQTDSEESDAASGSTAGSADDSAQTGEKKSEDPAAADDQSTDTTEADADAEDETADAAESKQEESAETSDTADTSGGAEEDSEESGLKVDEDGTYTSKEEVALYIHTYGHLPDNYITKRDAEDLGWDAGKGNLWEVTDGMSIGGNKFGNYEGNLPEANGRQYYECDIDYAGGKRNAKRIVYSNDGLIFYTEDHYNTFEQLY